MRLDPIWDVMRHQRRDYLWLASRTGYSHSHIKAIATGRFPASADFRSKCAFALDLPESVLFHVAPLADPAGEKVA